MARRNRIGGGLIRSDLDLTCFCNCSKRQSPIHFGYVCGADDVFPY